MKFTLYPDGTVSTDKKEYKANEVYQKFLSFGAVEVKQTISRGRLIVEIDRTLDATQTTQAIEFLEGIDLRVHTNTTEAFK